ncbi:MAG: efflux RND transporter permease subunit [Candidatus Paceibacterota bacterium]|jgi:multidrug efflux pump subunit AcrB
MKDFWSFFLHKRQFTYLLIVGIIIFGLISYFTIPKESTPEVQIPMGIITTVYPGASAEDMEKLVTNKLEDGLNNLENLTQITSSSGLGVSTVVVEFETSADIDKSIQKLKDELDKLKPELPSGAEDPMVMEINFADQPIMMVSISSELPATEFAVLAEDTRSNLKSTAGVSKILMTGDRKREVNVIVDKGKLDSFGVSLNEIIQSISVANASLPIGGLVVDGVNYNLKFAGDLDNADEVVNLPITSRDGRIIYLRDIATVYNGAEEAKSLDRFSKNGQPSVQAITLSIYKKAGGDITKIGDTVKKKLFELEKNQLQNSEVLISFDISQMIKDDLRRLITTGLETVALVMLVLFLTIGWREAIVAGLSIPLSFLIAFIGLKNSGNTINFISLFSLILAIGILVDSGIVVVESIYSRFNMGHSKFEAARETVSEYSWPLISGTMTTIAVFFPLFFLSGIVGKFIASIPYTTIFVLLASIFVALAVVPILTVLVVKKGENTSKLGRRQEETSHRLRNWYRNKLRWFFQDQRRQNKLFWGLIIAFIFSFGLPLSGLVETVFFPQSDVDYLYIDIEKLKGTDLEKTDLAVRAVEEVLYEIDDIESFITSVGSASMFNFGVSGSGENLGNITMTLKKNRKQTSSEILAKIKDSTDLMTEAKIMVMEPSEGPPTGAPLEIKITGEDLNSLSLAAAAVKDYLDKIGGARDITISADDELSDLVLTLNRDLATEFGLNAMTIAQTLRSSIYGVSATKIRQGGEDIDVFVKVGLNPGQNLPGRTNETVMEAISQLSVSTPQGNILLGSILERSIEKGHSTIEHENGDRLITVSGYLHKGTTASEVINELFTHKTEMEQSYNVQITAGGETEDMMKTFTEMLQALILGVLLMLVILVLEFNSFRYAFYTLMIIPLSLIGVFVGLLISRQALSFSSILGFIALAGIIVNNTILIIDQFERERQERKLPLQEAAIEAATTRLRPILLTTTTTFIGMIPLIFVNAMWGPLAFTVMFGMIFSVVLTLLLIPLILARWPRKTVQEIPNSN